MTGSLVGGLKMDGLDVELLWVDTAGERVLCLEAVTGRRFAGSGVPEETDGRLDEYHRQEWVRWTRRPY